MSASPQLEALQRESPGQLSQENCFHCGESLDTAETVFEPIDGGLQGFCCHGCHAATELIRELGLFAYYDHREPPNPANPTLARAEPNAAAAFQRFDDDVLQRSFVSREPDGERSATLSVEGMRCAACSWLLEERLARVPGVLEAHFGLANQRAQVRWDPAVVRLSEILARVAELGYRAAPFEPDLEEAVLRQERRATLRRLGVSGLGMMQVMMFSVALYAGALGDLERIHRDLLRVASWLVTTPVLAYAGLPFLKGAWRDLRALRIGRDVPISLALVVAYTASAWATTTGVGEVYFDSVCMFVFFISLGGALERDLRARAELRIRRLQQRVPRIAHRIEDKFEKDVPVGLLCEGDVLTIRPGENVPADGTVIRGKGNVSESLLTGEASPVAKQVGSAMLGGSENLDSELQMRVERTGAASTLQQIASLLDRAQLEKPPIALLANRLARVFLTSVVVIAAGVGLAWWWIDATRVVPIVVSVLIATCPCALSLATPAALAASTHGLAARGFLITRGHALEALARVTRIVFDKTGTVTESMPSLLGVDPLRADIDADEALRLAAQLEAGSKHPIARALRNAQPAEGLQLAATDLEVEPGAGVSGKLDARLFRLGRPDWAGALSDSAIEERELSTDAPLSSVLLADERGAIAWFDFSLQLRSGAVAVSDWLTQENYASALLSGDPSVPAVEAVAQRLTLRDARAGASPEDKLNALEEWIAGGDTVLAVGDGINDAPLLGRAQVSIAMGSGSDLARLRSDAVLLDDRLESIPLALRWAQRARRVVKQNFAWALLYNLSVLPLAATGLLPPYLAALGMSLSSLLVVGNSLRLRRAPQGWREG